MWWMRRRGLNWYAPKGFMALWTVLIVLTSSCAFRVPGVTAPTESALLSRVQMYWRAQQQGDIETLRSLVDPDTRDNLSQTIERMGRPNPGSRIVSWNVERVEMDGSHGTVWVTVHSILHHPLLGHQEQALEFRVPSFWIWKNGQWYVMMEEPSLQKLLERHERPAKGR